MSNQAGLGIGDRVHNQEINEYPADMKEDYLRLSDWVREMYGIYGKQIRIKVIDPQSMVGLWKHIRYRIRAYPTFLVNGSVRFAGWERVAQLQDRVDRMLAGTT